jgi:hypothetical protein
VSPRGTSKKADRKPVLVLAGEDRNDRDCMSTVINALFPDMRGSIHQIKKQPRLHLAAGELNTRVDVLIRLAKAKAEEVDGELGAFFVHEDYDAIECDERHKTRTRVQEALSTHIANSCYVLATWEIEAWLLLFPDALSATRKGWAVPTKYLGRDTARIQDPKQVLMHEVSRGGPKYRESDAVKVLDKAVELDLLAKPQGQNKSWQEFTTAVEQLRPGG